MPDYKLSNSLFKDDRWIEEVKVIPRDEATNDRGYAMKDEQDEEIVRAVMRPARARWWRQVSEGVATTGEYVMIVRNEEPVDQGDWVEYRGDRYRAGQVDIEFLDGFSVFEIKKVTD